MKGIILAGGTGSRLWPLTKVTNKHLLPVYDKPMIYYPLHTLLQAGIREILVVSGPQYAKHFVDLLGSGDEFGASLSYEIQHEAGGIADALRLAENFSQGEKVAVILGDNIFEEDITEFVTLFKKQKEGAMIFLKEVKDPERFGVAEVCDGKVVSIIEKPKTPISPLAVTGLYMYDSNVFSIIPTLQPSPRGEYEITDVNNIYIGKKNLTYAVISGHWTDAGTFESLFEASTIVRDMSLKKGQSK